MKDYSSERWEESEFRAIFLQHYARIVDVLMRLLRDRSHAEDVASDTFWRLYCHPGLRKEGNVGGWLYRTATNLGIDVLRASSRRQQREDAAFRSEEKTVDSNQPLEILLREEKCRLVRQVLLSIKPTQAQLLLLRSCGLSYQEIADALDVKMSGVGTMLNRAQEEFRSHYVKLHPNEEGL